MDYVALVSKLARVRNASGTAWVAILGLFAFGLIVRFALARYIETTPLAPFIPALPVAALVAGWRRATALMAISLAVVWLLPIHAAPRPALPLPFEARAVVFVLLGGFLIALTEALAQAVQRLDAVAQMNADLFRELQHRVANNFQIVAATLQKARRNIIDRAALEAIDHAVARIDSLGRLHRRLYDPAAYAAGLEPILREVLADTFRGVTVDMRVDLSAPDLTVGQMTTIVLLVNEAAINAAKHVFALHRGGRFTVSLAADGRSRLLTISDDGPGFQAAEGAAPRYGLSVMRGLAAQLGGTLEVSGLEGATIRVAFPG